MMPNTGNSTAIRIFPKGCRVHRPGSAVHQRLPGEPRPCPMLYKLGKACGRLMDGHAGARSRANGGTLAVAREGADLARGHPGAAGRSASGGVARRSVAPADRARSAVRAGPAGYRAGFSFPFPDLSVALAILVGAYGISRTRGYRLAALAACLVPVGACLTILRLDPYDPVALPFMTVAVLFATVFLPTVCGLSDRRGCPGGRPRHAPAGSGVCLAGSLDPVSRLPRDRLVVAAAGGRQRNRIESVAGGAAAPAGLRSAAGVELAARRTSPRPAGWRPAWAMTSTTCSR